MTYQTTDRRRLFIAFIALFFLPISGVSTDIYIPSLPAVAQYFNVSHSLTQLSVSLYMIGFGVMQLFAGGISDAYGRRQPLILASMSFILMTLAIPFTTSIYQLLMLRLLQGIAMGLISVPLRSIIPDLFKGPAMHKMTTYMTMVWSIGPLIAPAIGGYLQHLFGWQSNFYFLAGYSILAFLMVYFFMPETSVHRHPFNFKQMGIRYKTMITTWCYTQCLLINSLLYSLVVLFTVIGSFYFQKVLGYTAIEFGHVGLLIGLAWLLGSLLNRFLIAYSSTKKAKFTLSLMLFLSIFMTGYSFFFAVNAHVITLLVFLIVTLAGINFPSNFSKAIASFPTMTGSANALFGSSIFLLAGLSSLLGSFLKSTQLFPLMFAFIVIISVCLFIVSCQKKNEKTANQHQYAV